MIRHQLVQWILLPNGLTNDGQLSASVFVAPRLRPSEPAALADFADFADWPAVLSGLELVIERADGVTEAPRVMSYASTGLWQALFPSTTTVRAFEFNNLADRPLVSYPVSEVLGHLRERWASLALRTRDDLPVTNGNVAPIGPPLTPDEQEGRFTLAEHFAELRAAISFEGIGNGEERSMRLRNLLDSAAVEARALRLLHTPQPQRLIRPFGSGGSPSKALYALAGFHARPVREKPKDFPVDQEQARAELAEALDFHHHLSSLGDHPALLRGLGLVIDLEIRPDFVPQTDDADQPTPLRARVQRPSAFPPRSDDPGADTWSIDVTPWTNCRLTNLDGQAFFSAVERSPGLRFAHGFLQMDPVRYQPMAVDLDGLALKALNMAATLQNQEDQDQRPVEEPERDGIPSAWTGGVALVHTGRAEELHQDFHQARFTNDTFEQNPDIPLFLAADDLVRGYRMDIWSEADGRWRSLHSRHIAYTPERDPTQSMTTDDEGSVQLSLTSEADRPGAPADPDRALYAHEAIVTWDGWSLSVPRPGQAIPQEPAAPEAGADLSSMRLVIATSALAQSLPRLRFRSGYRMRVRTVDLAGNSHSLEAADHLLSVLEGTAQPDYVAAAPPDRLRYHRFEPVPPPELVPRLPFGPGESLERLVIRSTPGQSAAEYTRASQAAPDPFLRFQPFCDRHVAAAKASLHLVELHGMLDEAIEAVRGLDPSMAASVVQPFYELAARESGSFRDISGSQFVSTGTHEGVAEGYVCVDTDSVELPYLPDPLSVGAKILLTLEPNEPEQPLEVVFDDVGPWYDRRPFRLRLEAGDFTVQYDAGARLVTVGVQEGRTAELRLSSLFLSDPDVFGVLDWCRQVGQLDPVSVEQVYEAIKSGTHWMTAPWRDLVLVHAVQRPLTPPQLELDLPEVPDFAGRLPLARSRGATAADLAGRLTFDLPSTAQVDLSATWDEKTDDPTRTYATESEMVTKIHRDAFTLVVPEPSGTPWIPEVAPLIERINDRLSDTVVGFRTRGDNPDIPHTPEDLRLSLLAAATAPGLAARERRRLQAGAAQLEKLRAHELGDTKYRRVTYQPVAATRFREYFDPAMPVADGTTTGNPIVVEVLSSAPPAKPDVLQILPLLHYAQTHGADGSTTSEREGVGLRVWLASPWWSSGPDELLAVVCDRGGPLTPDSELSREITFIAQDPARGSIVPQPLTAHSFRNVESTRESVRLNGPGGVRDIAAFRPVWDRDRQAWYADVLFSTGAAYFPFVRLGLARYQPFSIPGCELSSIVPTAFVQTLPHRTLTCVLVSSNRAELTLSGPAPSSSMDAQGGIVAGSNLVAAIVEEHGQTITDPLLGWTAAGPETVFAVVLDGDGTARWSATLQLPDSQGRRLRIAVREYEIHSADDRSAEEPSPGLVAARRLVHADVVPL